jgi:hypothetical protein
VPYQKESSKKPNCIIPILTFSIKKSAHSEQTVVLLLQDCFTQVKQFSWL